MFAFNLLGVNFTNRVSGGRKMAGVDARRICIEVDQAKRREQLLQLDEHRIRSTPKRIGEDHASQMVNCMPQPALLRFALHKTPHLIDLRGLHTTDFNHNRIGTTPLDHHCIH
jgi:hypothetical protein